MEDFEHSACEGPGLGSMLQKLAFMSNRDKDLKQNVRPVLPFSSSVAQLTLMRFYLDIASVPCSCYGFLKLYGSETECCLNEIWCLKGISCS